MLYHTRPPADCCPAMGAPADVYVWWERVFAVSDKAPPAGAPFHGCGLPPAVDVMIRSMTCWPTPAPPIDYGSFAAASRYLADVADAGYRSLEALICSTSGPQRSVLWGVKGWWLHQATPVRPAGGCAGVEFKVTVQPNGAWPEGDVLPAVPV